MSKKTNFETLAIVVSFLPLIMMLSVVGLFGLYLFYIVTGLSDGMGFIEFLTIGLQL